MLAMVQGSALLSSPAWHIDLNNQALNGFPRLLGIWSPLALLTLFFVGVPILLFVWELQLPETRRVRVKPWWIGWFLLVLIAVGIEYRLRSQPFRLPKSVIPYLAFGGWLDYPVGVQLYTDDSLLMMKPQANMTHVIGLDGYSMGGSVFGGVSELSASKRAGGESFSSVRRTNGHGFDADFGSLNDHEHPATVVALGDSFTVGYPLPAEMTWPGIMASRLADAGLVPPPNPTNPLSAVATFACGNYTPHEGLMAMRLTVPPRLPKVIVAMYYESNDITDAEGNAIRRAAGMSPVREMKRGTERVPEPWITRVRLHALVARAIAPTDLRVDPEWRRYPWLRIERRPREELARIQADPMLSTSYSLPEGLLRWKDQLLPNFIVEVGGEQVETALDAREFLLAASPGEWPPLHTGWPYIVEGLEDLAALSQQAGVRVVVVLAPSKLRVLLPFIPDGELSAERLDPLPTQRGEWFLAAQLRDKKKSWVELMRGNEDAVARHLRRECGRLRLEFIDLAPPLREAIRDEERLPYLPWDSHWNSLGNRVAGDVVAAYLAETSEPGTTTAVANIDDWIPPIPGPLLEQVDAEEGSEAGAADQAVDDTGDADETDLPTLAGLEDAPTSATVLRP